MKIRIQDIDQAETLPSHIAMNAKQGRRPSTRDDESKKPAHRPRRLPRRPHAESRSYYGV